MQVAEVVVICGGHFREGTRTSIGFDTRDDAKSEFDRLSDLLKRREDRANDLEKMVMVKGIQEFTCPLSEITCVSFTDFAQANEQAAGVKDAFHNLFKN